MASDNDDDSISSSSSSDDEFLTIGTGNEGASSQEREAMIRKKLLESFYGKTAVQEEEQNEPAVKQQEHATDADFESSTAMQTGSGLNMGETSGQHSDHSQTATRDQSAAAAAQSNNIDSPHFDAATYTNQLIWGSSMHDMLETEERLALQVRTLDSTMQTLVYENYSKFIDATDAIRSIGVSVHSNEAGLANLATGMTTIDEQSRSVEDALGGLRDAVAEKLRVKRLLTRLETLLKLPATLKQQIAHCNYRSAAKSYLSASSILSKHSAGFESLRSIESECQVILTEMVRTLKHKMLHWSGQNNNVGGDESDVGDDIEGEENEADDHGRNHSMENNNNAKDENDSSEWMPPPEPTQNVSEIFECAGAILMLLPRETDPSHSYFDSGFSAGQCKAMTLACYVSFVDRILDAHLMELQEHNFEMQRLAEEQAFPTKPGSMQNRRGASSSGNSSTGAYLIPNKFMDSVLEAATLYGITFGSGKGDSLDEKDNARLVDFVSEAFATFLAHVRSVLLEISESNEDDMDENGEMKMESHDDGDAAYLEISVAMAHFLVSVRDLASGLTLPEVGINIDVASGLVNQAVALTEAMVQRRVEQKFYGLRIHIIRDCLKPFSQKAVTNSGENAGTTTVQVVEVVEVVQLASVALSDAMQLVDDVVRNILSDGTILSATATAVDYAMLKQAVQTSAHRFAIWLASTLEVLAGCENSDIKLIIDVAAPSKENDDDENDGTKKPTSDLSGPVLQDQWSDMSDDSAVTEQIDTMLRELVTDLEAATKTAYSNVTLAIADICRLAGRSVMESIHQSIVSSEGMGKKSKSSGIFPSTERSRSLQSGDDAMVALERFKLASSRTLALYAMNRGGDAASIACSGFHAMATSSGSGIPNAPRSVAWQVLEVVKLAAIDCANILGGDKRAGPVPIFLEDNEYSGSSSPLKIASLSNSAYGGAIKGLQLDVERMFIEKVDVYPHPSAFIDFTRTAVVTIVFQVALKAMMEHTRTCTFTTMGYRQLKVDTEFLRSMIPHYVEEDYKLDGTDACTVLYNLLNDVMLNAGQRCRDIECVGQEEFYDDETGTSRSPRSILKEFMTPVEESEERENIILRFTIQEE